MAHVESMDVDAISNEFDDKENSLQNSNVLPKTPSTEKGFEELDVSELNMKLRYSMTPASSPMSRSYTANSRDNSLCDNDSSNANLTRSFNSNITKMNISLKSPKFPLQALSTEQYLDGNGNPLNRSLDIECNNVILTFNGPDNEDNLSLPSNSSSTVHTPEATTPTKEIPKDSGSPILRGLKSVFNMFRPSQSPVPPENTNNLNLMPKKEESQHTQNLVSTPTTVQNNKNSKNNNLLKESVVFHEDLEKELSWRDETGIIFKEEKIPIHKLLFKTNSAVEKINTKPVENENMNNTDEYMDVSFNKSVVDSKTFSTSEDICQDISQRQNSPESDCEFLDCEIYTKNETKVIEDDAPILPLIIESSQSLVEGTEGSAFQPNNTISENNPLPAIVSDLDKESHTATTCIDNFVKENDLNFKQNLQTDLSIAENIVDHTIDTNIPNEVIQENIPKNPDIENSDNLVNSANETFNLVENSVNPVSTDIEHTVDTSSITNNTSLCDKDNKSLDIIETILIDEKEQCVDKSLTDCVYFNRNQFETDEDILKNNITLASELQVNEVHGVIQDENLDITINKCKEALPTENEVKSVPEIIKSYVVLNENNKEESSDYILMAAPEGKDNYENSPEHVPLPYDSDTDKKYLEDQLVHVNQEVSEKNLNYTPGNISIDNSNLNEFCSKENNTITARLFANSENLIQFSPITKTSHLEVSENPVNCNMDINSPNGNCNLNETMLLKENNDFRPESGFGSPVNNVTDPLETRAEDNENVFYSNISPEVESFNNEITQKHQNHTEIFSTNTEINREVTKNTVLLRNEESKLCDANMSVSDSGLSEYPFETINKLESAFEVKTSEIDNKVDIEQDSVKSPLDINYKNEVNIPSTNINTSVTEMELDVSRCDLEIKDNPFETKNKLTSSFEIQKSENGSKVDMEQDFGKSLLDVNLNNGTTISSTIINTSRTEMGLDIFRNDLEINANYFETKNKLTSSFEIQASDTGSKVVMQQDSAESLLNVSHENEIGIPSTIIDTTMEMEVDISKHDIEVNENPCVIENELENPLEVPFVAPIENEIMNEIDLETNDQFNETTAINKSIVAEKDLSKLNIEDMEKLTEENLNAETFETQLSMDDNKELLEEQPFEGTSEATTVSDNINDVIIAPADNNDYLNETNELEIKTDTEVMENHFETNNIERFSPPISSKFTHTGYNINFDDIDDAFATKTTLRMSPPPNISEENPINIKIMEKQPVMPKTQPPNRRKSYQERKKSNVGKKANVSFDCVVNNNKTFDRFQESSEILEDNHEDNKIDDIYKEKEEFDDPHILNEADVDINIESIDDVPQPSSMNSINKNVFNLPEIHDINFNPFAIKTKIRQSPDKNFENVLNNTQDVNPVNVSEDSCSDKLQKTINNDKTFEIEDNIQVSAKNLSSNLSCVTNTSYNTNDITVKEVHTEDEDTEEGPFLEAEDFADFVKITDKEIERDMINFDDLPPQSDIDNNENAEMFIDAEAFEFLLNQNKSNVVADSGKESLFLKFDPLFAKRVSSDSVVSTVNKIKNRQSTPKKPSPLKPIVQETRLSPEDSTIPINTVPVTGDLAEEAIAATFKPMMVVNPAVASIVSPMKSVTPPKANRRSLNFTSPAMVVIDRLLSLSGNDSRLEESSSVPTPRQYSETDFALTQLRELLAEKEINVHSLRSESKELKERLANMESQVRSLENESEERLRRLKGLNERLAEKNTINKSLAVVVEEYERTIASLIAGKEQIKQRNAEERQRIISERDEQNAHLASMAVSFRDLHRKYEKSKQIILHMKASQDKYKESIETFEETLLKMQNNYESLKQHATSKLNHANQELEKYNRTHEAEVLKLNAMIKRKELHVTSLEESLSQKTKANEELTAICDELINKVG